MQETKEIKEHKKLCIKRVVTSIIFFVIIPILILFGINVWNDKKYYIISVLVMLFSVIPLVINFEGKKPTARKLVIIAVMTALSVVSRAAFYMLPQFKPVIAMIIITAVAFGSEAGFITGACTGCISNFFFGQGPWTPWQMFGFGVVGFIAGLVFYNRNIRLIPLCIFGGFATLLIYGITVDTGTAFMYSSHITFSILIAVYSSGFIFNIIHAVSTIVFLAMLSKPMLKKLTRIKNKFMI